MKREIVGLGVQRQKNDSKERIIKIKCKQDIYIYKKQKTKLPEQ
jgi:hypothetical protein